MSVLSQLRKDVAESLLPKVNAYLLAEGWAELLTQVHSANLRWYRTDNHAMASQEKWAKGEVAPEWWILQAYSCVVQGKAMQGYPHWEEYQEKWSRFKDQQAPKALGAVHVAMAQSPENASFQEEETVLSVLKEIRDVQRETNGLLKDLRGVWA